MMTLTLFGSYNGALKTIHLSEVLLMRLETYMGRISEMSLTIDELLGIFLIS